VRDGIEGMLKTKRGIMIIMVECPVCGKRKDHHTKAEMELCVMEMSDSIRKEKELLK